MKTLFFSAKPFEINALKKIAPDIDKFAKFTSDALQLDNASSAAGYDAVSVFSNDNLRAEVLHALHQVGVKYISLRSAGYDHVDINKAKAIGMKVANVPNYSPYAIAEHSIMLIMALNRRLLRAQQLIAKNNWELDELIGFDMHGKTAGIIGTGHIGAIAARILHGFGCKLLAFDPYPDTKLAQEIGLQYVDKEALYKQSDIISLYCPLNEHTHYMIDKETIAKMKPGVMLINTARGAIVNTADLIDALETGQVGYFGADVYEREKGLFFYNHSTEKLKDQTLQTLLDHDRVIITGHQAFLTHTALKNIAETTLHNLHAMRNNLPCENLLT
ncbi:MAG: 2-hydroxyacid dehydrogenase [Flavobacteriales bacterium]